MHTIELLNYKQLSNGQLAVLARCCGDDVQRSWHTIATEVIADDTKFQNSMNWFYQRVASEHQTSLQANGVIASMIGTKTKVDLNQTNAPVAPAPTEPAPVTTMVQ
jgi:hypothetical protein